MALSLKTPPLQSRNLRNTYQAETRSLPRNAIEATLLRVASMPMKKNFFIGAVSEARTRDPQLGKLMLYQLSYYRVCDAKLSNISVTSKIF